LTVAGSALLAWPWLPASGWAADRRFLSGGYAPVRHELTLTDLPIEGAIPADFRGTYLRNGPNPAFEPMSYVFPFDGDGMVHALTFADGKASYRNRFVRTAGLAAERHAGHALWGASLGPAPADGRSPRRKNLANTNVVRHAGRLLALWEGGLPHRLTDDLDTAGPFDFDGRLAGAMTAHPKLDPETGELLFFGYAASHPLLTLYTADAAGRIVDARTVDMPFPAMLHDCAVTPNWWTFFAMPAILDANAESFVSWQPERGARVIAVPRGDRRAEAHWFEVDPFFVFHVMNGQEDGDRLIVDYVRRPSLAIDAQSSRYVAGPKLHRAVVDLARRTLRDVQLDDRAIEYPRIDDRRSGRRNRYGYAPAMSGREAGAAHSVLIRYDFETRRTTLRDFGPDGEIGEAVFAPRPGGTAEDDGWVVLYVYDRTTDRSRLLVLDAADLAGDPVATVRLPVRVPHGLHGNWLPEINI
jgi:carotenoid cleavage dioxygenase